MPGPPSASASASANAISSAVASAVPASASPTPIPTATPTRAPTPEPTAAPPVEELPQTWTGSWQDPVSGGTGSLTLVLTSRDSSFGATISMDGTWQVQRSAR